MTPRQITDELGQRCRVCSLEIEIPVLRSDDPRFPWTIWYIKGMFRQELHKRMIIDHPRPHDETA